MHCPENCTERVFYKRLRELRIMFDNETAIRKRCQLATNVALYELAHDNKQKQRDKLGLK
jgi:hypothetical protein